MGESSLAADNINMSYHQGETKIEVLKGLNLDVKRGEAVAILGQSGSGKSTLLTLLAGLEKPMSGHITLHDTVIDSLSEQELARFRGKHMGIVFQQFHLMSHMTAEENVALPLEIGRDSDAKKKALEALTAVGLGDRADHLPSQLSGGECQRVAIARAFVSNPDVILADEPSGSLDSRTGEQVMNILFELAKNQQTTLILVTHNSELAKRCDRIVYLYNGILHNQPEAH